MKTLTATLICIFFLGIQLSIGQSLNLTLSNSPTQLIQNGFVGPGVNVSNVTGQLGPASSATFTNNGIANFPFSSGLILTTGEVTSINNPPSFFQSTSQGISGDPLLDAVVAPNITYDAQVLTFEFSAIGDSIEFDFIFSSEEYHDYVNTPFNDVFGFFVSGPGYAPNTNVAIVPGTSSTPVSINNVNNGGPTSGPATGPCVNCFYFIDNLTTPATYPLAPDGLTTGINIRFAVQPCATYTFKIAIADVSDGVFDSQVFLKQGSFTPCSNPRISASGILVQNTANPIQLCFGDSIELSVPSAPSYSWSNGDTTQTIIVSQSGIYSAIITNGSCFAFVAPVEVIVGNAIPPATISFSNDTLHSNYNLPGYTFSWTFNGQLISGATQNLIQATTNGCYTLVVTDSTGCSINSNTFCVGSTGIEDITSSSLTVIPNPVTGTSIIETDYKTGTTTQLKIFNSVGKLVKQETSKNNNQITISNTGLADGIYFIELSNSGTTEIRKTKIVVER